jgi:hypothetical protein
VTEDVGAPGLGYFPLDMAEIDAIASPTRLHQSAAGLARRLARGSIRIDVCATPQSPALRVYERIEG